MRARTTITTIVVLGALAIPVSASAQSIDSDYTTPNAITGGSSGTQAPQFRSARQIAMHRGTLPSAGSPKVDPGHSSLNAITGPADEPTFVSGPPSNTADGFDWASAGIGAGTAMALIALGGAVLLTVRRRTAVSPSAAR